MSWPTGLTQTQSHDEVVTNPDGTHATIHVHGGPFFFYPKALGGRVFFYIGFRPTATWGAGYGDEGWLAPLARWLKRRGWGNFGIALRRAQ